MVSRKISIGLLTAITLIALPMSTHAKSEQVPLKQRLQEDHGYRNRYYAGWGFFWLLVVIGLFVLINPHQKGPQPRQG